MRVEGKGRKREVCRVMRREESVWKAMRVLKRKGRRRCKEKRGRERMETKRRKRSKRRNGSHECNGK